MAEQKGHSTNPLKLERRLTRLEERQDAADKALELARTEALRNITIGMLIVGIVGLLVKIWTLGG